MTYEGSAELIDHPEGAYWSIKAQPYVYTRLKRLFPKINVHKNPVMLHDSDENCADLLWFMQRHPLRVSDADRAHLERREVSFVRQRDEVHAILNGEYEPPETRDLALPLREYQLHAVHLWLAQKTLLVADDVGVGKSATAIGGVVELLPAVIVCPTHLPKQWKDEFAKFAPWLNVHIARKGSPYEFPPFHQGRELRRGTKLAKAKGEPVDVLVITYSKIAGWDRTLEKWAKSVVFDEVQRLARRGSNTYQAAATIAAGTEFQLGLSATPIRNYGGEIHNVFDALKQDSLGTTDEFRREWCGHTVGQAKDPLLKDPKSFSLWLRDRGMMLRRTRKDIGRELPPVQKIPHFVESDPEALEAIEDSAVELAKIILGEVERTGFEAMQAAGEFDWRLRQATGLAKAPYCAEFVRMLVENGEQVLVGVWHREVYEIFKAKLDGIPVAQYSGSETASQKNHAKDRFMKGEAQVMLLSLRSGEGLDGLQQACSTVVFAELDWSYAVHEQFTGRIARDGQESPVVAYYLLSEEGSDPFVMDRLGLKRQQSEHLVNPEKEDLERLQIDPDHIKKLAAEYLERKR